MSKKVVLIKSKNNIYQPEPLNVKVTRIDDIELSMIYHFLECDYIDIDSLSQWLKNVNQDWCGTNTCFLEKKDGVIVLSNDDDYEHKYAFKTTGEYMLDMVKQWHKIFYDQSEDKWPKKVTISLDDDGKVTITPED